MIEITTRPPIEVTVVLLGHDEADHRPRAFHYYAQAGVPCIAVEPMHVAGTVHINKERLQGVLAQVATPFVCLALDADFVLPDALQSAQVSLRAQPQAMAVQGHALAYSAGNGRVTYRQVGAAFDQGLAGNALARISRYALAAQPAWRAVVRVSALNAALVALPDELDVAGFCVALSYALLVDGEITHLDHTDVVCEYVPGEPASVAREERLTQAVHCLRQMDAACQEVCADEEGFAVLNHLVQGTYDNGEAPVLFTSRWGSVTAEPERVFEPRQCIELPYYSRELFGQLSVLEFLCHAWPAGRAQHQALEGSWVRQRDLLQAHLNDTPESLQLRLWQALALGLFDVQVCQRLLATLTGKDDEARASELNNWLVRLEQVPGIASQPRLLATHSGQVLAALDAAALQAADRQRVVTHLSKHPAGQMAFVVLDLADDDGALQATFDSLLASGIRDFKLVVLKAGKPPAITTARDTLHFIQVNEGNWPAHLNQVVRQLPSEWLLLLRAGDQLLASGLMHLLVELSESPACQAICANEVQRDEDGRLHAVMRPGADLNLLRSQPRLMSRHWLVRRQAVLDLGGYSESNPQAFELDLLLRLVEAQGIGSLAHLDDYLLIGQQSAPALNEEALTVVSRHLTQLGYRAQLKNQQEAGLSIDLRHPTTPLVSVLVAGEGGLAQIQSCLTSVLQRTRYPRFEVVVACADDGVVAQQNFGGRVRLVVGEPGASRNTLLNLAASQARGEYLVLLSARCQVIAPAWIEALLNEAQRPEVGVTGGLLLGIDGLLAHAGYTLLSGPQLDSPWQGLSLEASAQAQWPHAVRSCPAVSGDCLMVRKSVFEDCDRLQAHEGGDIALCLAAGEMGQMVVWAPQAQLLIEGTVARDSEVLRSLGEQWPAAFSARGASENTLGWLAQVK